MTKKSKTVVKYVVGWTLFQWVMLILAFKVLHSTYIAIVPAAVIPSILILLMKRRDG
nr:hypothetical protein [Bacilli bacterium]